jgi:hypothetical protein
MNPNFTLPGVLPGISGSSPGVVVSSGIGNGLGNIPMTNGVPTANLIALLHLQQQQQGTLGALGQGIPGVSPTPVQAPLVPGLIGLGTPPPELAALMMSTFTPRPVDSPCTIYVGNLTAGITSDQLKQFFGSWLPLVQHHPSIFAMPD